MALAGGGHRSWAWLGSFDATLSSGRAPISTLMVLRLALALDGEVAAGAGGDQRRRGGSDRGLSSTALPSMAVTMSPCSKPALAAGPFGTTLATMAPLASLRPSEDGDFRRHALDLDAQPAARDMAMRLKLRHHVMDGGGRNGEADADAAARGREDHRIHADHLAAQVEGRAAGIAAIDRRVDLDEVVIIARADVAADRGDDARGHRIGKAEGIADRDHPVADAQLRGRRRIPRSAAACRL